MFDHQALLDAHSYAQLRARKLARLRHAVDAAEDPTAIFEATADLIEAMCSTGAASHGGSPHPPGPSAGSTPLPTCSGTFTAQQDHSLARTLCAALSEPLLLKQGQAGTPSCSMGASASPASVSVSAASPQQPQHRQHAYQGAGSAGTPMLQLRQAYSAPQGALDAESELARTASLTALSGDALGGPAVSGLDVSRSFSAVQLEGGSGSRQPTHPARSAQSSMQLQELLHMRSLQLKRRQQQQAQQQAQSKEWAPLQQLLEQQLQEEGMLASQQQLQQQQQERRQQLLLLLLQQQQQQQQQCQQEQEDRKALLLARLKRAIAVTAARNRLGLQ